MTAHTRDFAYSPSVSLVVESPYLWRARRADCTHRLICFPHAGGGAGAFGGWAAALPPQIEVSAVQLPGRQNRMFEDPATDVASLLRELRDVLRPLLDRPFSLFGHSCGALLAYEFARILQLRREPAPTHLFLSGESSPQAAQGRPKLSTLSEEDFRAEVLRLGGFDEEIADDEDALESLLPPVIADFALWESHRTATAPRLTCPITALGGDADYRATPEAIDGWRLHTAAQFTRRIYPGGHFYLFDPAVSADLLDYLSESTIGTFR